MSVMNCDFGLCQNILVIIVLSYYRQAPEMMSVVVICGSCGHVIGKMHNLKPVKEVLRSTGNLCVNCGKRVSLDFAVKARKRYAQ